MPTMTHNPFVQSEYATKRDLRDFADQVQDKLDDLKGELSLCIDNSRDEVIHKLRKDIALSKDEILRTVGARVDKIAAKLGV